MEMVDMNVGREKCWLLVLSPFLKNCSKVLYITAVISYPFSERQILDFFNRNKFADDNFKLDGSG